VSTKLAVTVYRDTTQLEEGDELIVVDNASTDDTVTTIRQKFTCAKIIQNDTNLGVAGGLNVGLKYAQRMVVAFINQDVILQPGCLAALHRVLLSDEKVGVVGCKILYADGKTIQHAGGKILPPLTIPIQIGRWEEDHGQYEIMQAVDYVTGAVFATRKRLFEEIGYFDEGFFPAYYEETDLCFRVRAKGYQVLYVPEAVIIHLEETSLGRFSPNHYYSHHKNRLRFAFKHYSSQEILYSFLPAELVALRLPISRNEAVALRQAYMDDTYEAIAESDEKHVAIETVLASLRQYIATQPLNTVDDESVLRRLEAQ
jgi:GT2 family glycosyltransferase